MSELKAVQGHNKQEPEMAATLGSGQAATYGLEPNHLQHRNLNGAIALFYMPKTTHTYGGRGFSVCRRI